MPIEIRELIIRAIVDPRDEQGVEGKQDGGMDREELVRECVDETLRVLRRARER